MTTRINKLRVSVFAKSTILTSTCQMAALMSASRTLNPRSKKGVHLFSWRHSCCGKSTLCFINIVAGLAKPTGQCAFRRVLINQASVQIGWWCSKIIRRCLVIGRTPALVDEVMEISPKVMPRLIEQHIDGGCAADKRPTTFGEWKQRGDHRAINSAQIANTG